MRLVNNSRPADENLGGDERVPVGPTDQWQAQRQRVSMAAGDARHAYERHGTYLTGPGLAWMDVDPVRDWELSLLGSSRLQPTNVVSAVDMARATAAREHRDALEREKGLKGVLADFLRWPAELREVVGPSPAQQRAATAIGVFGQLAVGTITTAVGGAATTGIVAACLRAWQLVTS